MYSYTIGNPDEDIYVKEGQALGGCAVGIILSDFIYFPNVPGDVANANTFDFPVHYSFMEGLKDVNQIVTSKPTALVRDSLIKAGKALVRQGCRAISSDCGFYANYQNEVAAALDAPVFLSSLLQVPIVLRTLKPNQKLGIICARGSSLTEAPALRAVGVDEKSLSRIAIAGISDAESSTPPEKRQIQNVFKGKLHMNPKLFEDEMVDIAMGLVKKNPDMGAMMLEGSIFPAFAYGIQKAIKLPVYDFSTLIKWAHSAVVRRPFAGYV